MTLTILAVDDSRTMREMVRMTLASAGMQVSVAEDGVHGLETLETGLRPDAIISDINMPRLDGFGFIRAVRQIERLRGVPIVVLTTENAPELRARARDAGATGWLVKPFDPERLVQTIQMVAG